MSRRGTRLDILIDNREPKSMDGFFGSVIKHLKKTEAIHWGIKHTQLQAGDYRCNNVLIERKTVDDAVASIQDGRLKGQVPGLLAAKENGVSPILVIVGDMSNVHKTRRRAILTTLARYYLPAGIPVICVPDEDGFAWFCVRVFQHGVGGIGTLAVDTVQVAPKTFSVTERMLRAIDGVGQKIAAKFHAANLCIEEICTLTVPSISMIISEPVRTNWTKQLHAKHKKKPYKIAKTIWEGLHGKESLFETDEWILLPEEEAVVNAEVLASSGLIKIGISDEDNKALIEAKALMEAEAEARMNGYNVADDLEHAVSILKQLPSEYKWKKGPKPKIDPPITPMRPLMYAPNSRHIDAPFGPNWADEVNVLFPPKPQTKEEQAVLIDAYTKSLTDRNSFEEYTRQMECDYSPPELTTLTNRKTGKKIQVHVTDINKRYFITPRKKYRQKEWYIFSDLNPPVKKVADPW